MDNLFEDINDDFFCESEAGPSEAELNYIQSEGLDQADVVDPSAILKLIDADRRREARQGSRSKPSETAIEVQGAVGTILLVPDKNESSPSKLSNDDFDTDMESSDWGMAA